MLLMLYKYRITDMADSHVLTVDPVEIDEVDDDNLMKAIEESHRFKSTMPLIKQELRYTIQYRRLSSGQEELVVDKKAQPEYKLTHDEVLKKHRRREQNRQSSVRCRRKRKEYNRNLEKAVSELELKQCDLQLHIKRLHLEKKHLEKLVKTHLKLGECKIRKDMDQTAKQRHAGSRNHVSGHDKISLMSVNKHKVMKCRPHKASGNQVRMVSLLSVH